MMGMLISSIRDVFISLGWRSLTLAVFVSVFQVSEGQSIAKTSKLRHEPFQIMSQKMTFMIQGIVMLH